MGYSLIYRNKALNFLQLGSNLGNRELLLQDAVIAVEDRVGSVVEKSKIYEAVHLWYAKDKGQTVEIEIVSLLQ